MKELYGLKVKKIKELDGYIDKNFKVLVEETFENPYIANVNPYGYTLKILNWLDSKYDHVGTYNYVMRYLLYHILCVSVLLLCVHVCCVVCSI